MHCRVSGASTQATQCPQHTPLSRSFRGCSQDFYLGDSPFIPLRSPPLPFPPYLPLPSAVMNQP